MLIIDIQGGLGNQLFQYALAKMLHGDVRLYLQHYQTTYEEETKRRCYAHLFASDFLIATPENKEAIERERVTLSARIRRKLHLPTIEEYLDLEEGFQPEVLKAKNGYIMGYWQSECYFEQIADALREEWNSVLAKTKLTAYGAILEQKIKNSNRPYIAVHVRGGDYLNSNNYSAFGAVCSLDYYSEAKKRILEQEPNCKFLIFSDNVSWAKEKLSFHDENTIYVDQKTGEDDVADLYLMSICPHIIMANSTYSWWAAWLGKKNDQIVYVPTPWRYDRIQTDIYCKGWNLISMNQGKQEL